MIFIEMRGAFGAEIFPWAEINMPKLLIFFSLASKISGHLDDSEEDTKNVTDDEMNSSLLLSTFHHPMRDQ